MVTKLKCNTKVKDSDGSTALTLAAAYSDESVLEFLLDSKTCEIEETGFNDETALLSACTQRNNLANVQYLVRRGASLVARDSYGIPPISRAAMYGDLETIQYLLAVEPETINELGFEGRTPLLSSCAVKGNWENIKFLIDYRKVDKNLKISKF